ncbi:uncharacterized protein LOC126719545 [Quercus robur]|uniref:uncharacterized protein LOC126719545 n=1 Tax=Quercus robur TaxID=38942 RepID=UPI002162C3FB|nr:uncharacterized protein LOC126719545 [Quercus robur]
MVLVDNGSSADILYYLAFQQMRIERERLIPTNAPLVGFGGTRVYPLGAVTLLMMVGDYLQQITKDVTFLVVDYLSAYNAILGHPTLNTWKAVTSTYHLMIKFPTKYEIGEVKGDQVAARECYIVMLEMNDQQQTICIEEQRTIVEPVEELEEVTLDESRPKRTTRKKRVFAPEQDKAIAEEVRKLLEANFIREVYYPDWLANMVMVKKANGKWRICVDFTDLNRAFPKDSYPLPQIDTLVDSTMRHQLLSFMDVFSRYNQIRMEEAD